MIVLFNGYFIEIDPLNHTLKQKYTGKDKDGNEKEAERIIGYYPNVKAALKRFVSLVQVDETDNRIIDMEQYLEAVEKANQKVMDYLEKLFK